MDNKEKFDIEFYLANRHDGMACFFDGEYDIRMFESMDMYVKQKEPKYPNMVCTQMMYDGETLFLREKGQYLKHGGIGIGIWEYYNEEGILDHTENMEEHFPITWEKLEQILKDKDISLLSAESIFRYYDEAEDTATWSITIKLDWDKGYLYIFDGRTGELLKEEVVDLSKEL